MTGFFAHLAARARHVSPSVRPRLPQPFEPPPIAATGAPDTLFAAELIEEASSEERLRMPAPAVATVFRPPETPSAPAVEAVSPPAAPAAPPVPQASAPTAAAPSPADAPRVSSAAPTVAAAHLPTPATPAREPVFIVGGIRAEPIAAPPGPEVSAPRSSDEPPPAPPPAPPTPPSTGVGPASTPRHTPIALAGAALAGRIEASLGARVARALPSIPPRRERVWRGTATPAAVPSPETTIQVSIGRIEVRAAAPPPARVREAPVSPVMSLDEYLRTRARRARS